MEGHGGARGEYFLVKIGALETVCYTATSWFVMVSASCNIDPTET